MPKNIFTFTDPGEFSGKECFVFLPGWGFSGRIIELAPPRRAWVTVDGQLAPDAAVEDLADFLDRQGLDSIVLVGWSLGACVAVEFMLRYPERVTALYLLAMRRFWPPSEIEGIRADLSEDPDGFMKSFYRKCFLGHPSDYLKFRDSFEDSCLAELDLANLEAGLDYLRDFRLNSKAEKVARLNIPTYVLHGAKDIIAPPAEMAVVPGAVNRIIKSAGHPVFLDQNCPLDWHHKKETIRLKFSRAAATYDDHAALQREIAEELVEQLPLAPPPATILETGCGTGTYTRLLNKRFPAARITAIDFAETMLAQAREKLAGEAKVAFHCTDAELFLRETEQHYDLVTSNSTMHWFDSFESSATLISQRLTAHGALIGSIFGPETMGELQTGLEKIHGRQVMAPSSFFLGKEELQKILSGLFGTVEINERRLVRHYSDLNGLLNNISKTGTAGWHPGRHLLNRRQMQDLEQWFIETYGHCQVSYQIFMVNCRKPESVTAYGH